MSDIDSTVRQLFAKLDERKKKVAALKTEIGKSWKTNCTLRLMGSTATTNIQTASVEVIEECALHIALICLTKESAVEMLGRPVTSKISGYTKEDWVSDFKKRLATIDIREEESQLAALETRLNQVLSPEERRRIEVEILAKELGA